MRDYISKEYSLSIDFLDYSKNKNTEIKSIIYNEKDTNTAFVIADLFANGEPINLNGYDKVVVGIKKSDGLRVQNDCTILDSINGQIEVPFTTQSLASVGVNYFDITLYKEKTELVSPKFSYRVMESMIDDDTLESSNEFGTLVLLIEKTEELLNRTNEACDRVETLEEVVTANELVRNTNEEVRKTNEASRVSSENTRKSNETNRTNSENIRVSSENARVSFYNETVSKESIRVTKENERIASENTRILNETNRTNSENTRKSNETTRVNSENVRVSAENTRKSNETLRVSNEQTRVTNESNRESEFEILSNNMVDTNTHWDTTFQNRYDNLNQEYAGLVDTLDKDILASNSSEDLLNESITSFKVGTGKVNGVAKDYSSKMEQSLVSIDNIVGKTEKINNRLVNRNVKCLYIKDKTDSKDYFNNKSQVFASANVTSSTSGTNITVSTITPRTWGEAWFDAKDCISGETYVLTCDSVSSSDDSCIEIKDAEVLSLGFLHYKAEKEKCSIDGIVFRATGAPTIKLFATTITSKQLSQVFTNIKISKIKSVIPMDIELRSLPNGKCDNLVDSVYIKNVCSLKLNSDCDWYQAGDNGGKKQYFVKLPNVLEGKHHIDDFEVAGRSLALDKVSTDTANSTTGGDLIFIAGDSLYVRTSMATLDDFKKYLKNNSGDEVIYQLKSSVAQTVNTSIIANSGDTIFVDSPLPIDCTHKVQLNTKSQVEELQEVIIKEKKNVWEKIKELTDVQMNLSKLGYIRFPTILGGFLIQWGDHHFTRVEGYDWLAKTIMYPISFNEVFTIQLSVDTLGTWDIGRGITAAIDRTDGKTNNTSIGIIVQIPDDTASTVRWFAVGK